MAKASAPVQTPAEQLAAKRQELVETQRSHAAGELVNPRALGRIRKEIARLLTQQNAPVTEIKEINNEATATNQATIVEEKK